MGREETLDKGLWGSGAERRARLDRWSGGVWQSAGGVLFVLLVLTDVLFIILHIWSVQTQGSDLMLLTTETGYAEALQNLKFGWLAILAVWAGLVNRRWRIAGWALLFAYLMADDVFMLHEMGGRRVFAGPGIDPGAELAAIGEVIVAGVLGIGCIIGAVILYREPRYEDRRQHRPVIVLLILLAFFGVVVDAVHAVVTSLWRESQILNVVEDGGEHVVVSALVALFFSWILLAKGEKGDGPTSVEEADPSASSPQEVTGRAGR